MTIDFAGGADEASGLVLQPDGKLLAAGRTSDAQGTRLALARLEPARKIEEDLFRVPMSVQALSGDFFDVTDPSSLFEMQMDVPLSS